MNPLERRVIRSHTVILKIWNGLHSLFRHILLSKYLSKFLGAIVTEVDEDDYITLFDCSVYRRVMDWFDKFVGDILSITLFHGLNHIRSLFALSVYDQVISLFHTVPAFITIHCIENAVLRTSPYRICQ